MQLPHLPSFFCGCSFFLGLFWNSPVAQKGKDVDRHDDDDDDDDNEKKNKCNEKRKKKKKKNDDHNTGTKSLGEIFRDDCNNKKKKHCYK